jgi:Rrf2 family protein
MLSLTRKTDYALVALSYLAQRKNQGLSAVSARHIAERFNLPLALLMNVLKELGQSRIVKSTRGAQGGYELLGEPESLSVLEVITSLEGPVRFAACTEELPILGQGCEVCNCPIRKPIQRLHERIVRMMEGVSLQDLLDQDSPTLQACPEEDRHAEHRPEPTKLAPAVSVKRA